MEDRILRGRQIVFTICKHVRETGAHEAVLDYFDLFHVALHGDDDQDFDARWDEVLSSISEVPNDGNLESSYQQCWQCTNKQSIRIHRRREIRS